MSDPVTVLTVVQVADCLDDVKLHPGTTGASDAAKLLARSHEAIRALAQEQDCMIREGNAEIESLRLQLVAQTAETARLKALELEANGVAERFRHKFHDAEAALTALTARHEATVKAIDIEINCTPPSRHKVVLPMLRAIRARLAGGERSGT